MKNYLPSVITLFAFSSLALVGCPLQLGDIIGDSDSFAVALRGTVVGEERSVPDLDGDGIDDTGLCFDLEIVDLETGEVLGTATDCLSSITEVGDALTLEATTEFVFPDGSITVRGLTTVQPILVGSSPFTHGTSAAPGDGENSILSGTGAYEGATGTARLSGLVALNPLEGGDLEITFDCIFVVNID